MNRFVNSVDRFCAKHPRFGIPNLMIFVIVGNLLIWLFSAMDTTGQLLGMLYFSPAHILQGQIWRLVTFVLVPESTSFLMLVALYFYYLIGNTLERHWGSGKFTIYYLCGMFFTILYGFVVYFVFDVNCYVSAYYINLSMFFSFATLYPDTLVLLFFVIPIKIKWLAVLDGIYFVLAVFTNQFPYNFLPVMAVLNYLLFCGGWIFDAVRPQRVRQRYKTINYKKEAQRINREQARKPYNRKCEVCGRTDTDYPDLEFRYCSRCAGYHCFCMDHINSHVHFTE
jgi:hypothetical protein